MNSFNNSALYIQPDIICDNIRAISRSLSGCEIIPVLKCDAYGLGLVPISRAIASIPEVRCIALAHVQEGILLRESGITKKLLILGEALPFQLRAAAMADLTLSVSSAESVRAIAAMEAPLGIQIKIDTGLHRLGCGAGAELEELLSALRESPMLRLEGVFSHFTDSNNDALTAAQFEAFQAAASQIRSGGFTIPCLHICDSAATENHPEFALDAVRIGRRLYMDHPDAPNGSVRECCSWRSYITHIAPRRAGDRLGYSGVHLLHQDALVASVGVGYGDGLPDRAAETGGCVLIHGERRNILAVFMDQCLVDVTGLNVNIGDEVTFFGYDRAGHFLSVQEVANTCHAREGCGITSALSSRVERVYL